MEPGLDIAWCCPISASDAGSQPVSGQRKRDCRNSSSGPAKKSSAAYATRLFAKRQITP